MRRQHQIYCDSIVSGDNQTEAARKAKYKEKHCRYQGSILATKDDETVKTITKL